MGAKGANIAHIRESTGAQIHVDQHSHRGHQLARLIGPPDTLRAALQEVVSVVEQELSGERLQEWASEMIVVNAWESENTEVVKGKGGKGGGGGLHPRKRRGGDEGWHQEEEEFPASGKGSLQDMMAIEKDFPDGCLDIL